MIQSVSITDIGKRRKLNQDYVYVSDDPVGNLPNVYLVADGMGGHNAGDFASKCAVEQIVGQIKNSDETQPDTILEDAIWEANAYIYAMAERDRAFSGMGTTIVAACIDGNVLYAANVGDSRLYIVNDREIRQITKDHSYVEEMVRMGKIDKKSAKSHPDKNIITRAVGAVDTIEVDFFVHILKNGDMVLMCSDGLTNMLEDEEIQKIVIRQEPLQKRAETLVAAANENGGKDNITVIVVEPVWR